MGTCCPGIGWGEGGDHQCFLRLCCSCRAACFFSLHLAENPHSFPKPLSAKEEETYLRRWAEGDLEARNLLVEHNLRLVAHIIKKYYTQSDHQDDLISIGTIGLIKGDLHLPIPDKGVRLATYASKMY